MRKNLISRPATAKQLLRYKEHLLDRSYMSEVHRGVSRVKANAEVFTPDHIVQELVGRVGIDYVCDPTNRIIDPACGDGQFLAYILYCRLKAGVPLREALATIYGIENEADNVMKCRERLRCGHSNKEVIEIVNLNIAEADSRAYHMRFDGTYSRKKPKQTTFGF